MVKYTIGIIIGSIRKESLNKKLANGIIKMAPSEFEFKFLSIDDLPLYNQDQDTKPAKAQVKLKTEIRSCNAILFVTPEYNRSIPGVLKNALDHASRPYGESAWRGIPAGVIGVSVGAIGTACAQQHLRCILSYLDMPTMPQPEVFIQNQEGLFEQDGSIVMSTREFLEYWLNCFMDWVKKHSHQI